MLQFYRQNETSFLFFLNLMFIFDLAKMNIRGETECLQTEKTA